MKLHPSLLFAALSLATAPVFADVTKPEDAPNTPDGSTQIRLGPISVAVSVSTTETDNKKSAYLGVVTSTLLPQLRAQLPLSEGMGLCVDAVAAGSPAEKAGLKQYDVLKKFNDQMLCTQDQLAVLVKAAGAGSKVSLGIIRGGKEQNVDVTLGEHTGPAPGGASFSVNGVPGVSLSARELENQIWGRVLTPEPSGIHDRMRDQREEIQKHVNDAIHKAQEAAAARHTGGGPKMFSIYPDTHTSSHNVVVLTDNDGTVEVTEADGQKGVRIKDAGGQEIYSGSLNSDAEHEAVPEKYRGKVKDAEERMKTNTAGAPKNTRRRLQFPPQNQAAPGPTPPPQNPNQAAPAPPIQPSPPPPSLQPGKGDGSI